MSPSHLPTSSLTSWFIPLWLAQSIFGINTLPPSQGYFVLPKEYPKAKKKSSGRSISPSGCSFLPAYSLTPNVATAIKKVVLLLAFIFFLLFHWRKYCLTEMLFLLAAILLKCFAAPCSEFLFLFLPAVFSNEVGSLCCRSSSGWAVVS